jgi:hypothetical protein
VSHCNELVLPPISLSWYLKAWLISFPYICVILGVWNKVSGNLEPYLFTLRNQQLQEGAIKRFTIFNVTSFNLMWQAIPPLLIRAEHHIIPHQLLRT